jgi:poly(A) polymerase
VNELGKKARDITARLQEAGYEAFWVGGCVRDLLLKREPCDYDIGTSARPEDIESLFKRTIPVGRKFGVIIVVEGGHEFQVATFRAEGEYRDGRRPGRVSFSDARADASRRDFTINGMFYDPVRKQSYDWVGGKADLSAKLVRCIGNAEERFGEDHLRLLRAVRFAAQLGFQLESQTQAAVRKLASKIRVISPERIRDELLKLFSPPHASRGLELLHENGLLEHVLPELAAASTCEQSPDFHPEGNLFAHLVLMLKSLPAGSNPLLPWAVLLHDVAKPVTASCDPDTGSIHFYGHERVGSEMAESILERLRFPRKQIDAVVKAVRCHMQFKDVPNMRISTLRRLLMRSTFPLELELHRLDCLGSHGRLDVYNFLVGEAKKLSEQPRLHPPLLRGTDLMALGMQPGPAMGALLAEAREKQLQGELETAEQARDWARKQIADPQPKATTPSGKRRKAATD